MRFIITVTGAGTGKRSISIAGCPPREVAIQASRPFPDATELAAYSAQTAALCDPAHLTDLNALYDRFLANGLAAGESEFLGQYLFAVLLGPNWAVMRTATPAGDIAELELEIDPADTDMQSLPWEMMHSSAGFLANCNAPRTTLSRIIPPAGAFAKPAFEAPFRVLFVVGSQLNAALRPGLELIGLLRRPGNLTLNCTVLISSRSLFPHASRLETKNSLRPQAASLGLSGAGGKARGTLRRSIVPARSL